MKNLGQALARALLPVLLLAACAGPGGRAPLPGEPLAAVEARLGPPSAVYRAGDQTVLEYATGPFGQFTYMAQIGADGRLSSYEQVLTDEKFGTIRVGLANKQDVLRTVGHPAETSYLALPRLEVWSYRYRRSGVWNAMMHVHFDRDGIVRMLQSGPDPLDEERERPFFR